MALTSFSIVTRFLRTVVPHRFSTILLAVGLAMYSFSGCGERPKTDDATLAPPSSPSRSSASASTAPKPADTASTGLGSFAKLLGNGSAKSNDHHEKPDDKKPGDKSARPAVDKAADTSADKVVVRSAAEKPISDAEAKEFVTAFDKALTAGDAKALGEALDEGAMIAQAIQGLGLPSNVQSMHFRGSAELAGKAQNEARHFAERVAKGDKYSLVHARMIAKMHCALFRFLDDEGRMTYIEFLLARDANDKVRITNYYDLQYADCILERYSDGKVRIADFFALEDSGFRSELYGKLMADFVKNYKPSDDSKKEQVPAVDPLSFTGAFTEMQKLANEGRSQEAVALFAKLPEALQKDKSILLARLRAAERLEGDAFDKAVADYRRAFPNEANLDIYMINVYTARKLYDRVMASISGLDHSIGGDPYLNVLRCEVSLKKKDLAAARQFARKAVDVDPTLFSAYKVLLMISLRQRKFSETSELLTAVQKQFPHLMPNVTGDGEYSEYRKSSQYRVWAKKQAK